MITLFCRQSGGTSCKSTWIWGVSGDSWQCLYYGSFSNTCPCTSFSCDGFAQGSGACKCAMQSNPTNDYCFTSTKACPQKCKAG